MAYQPEAGKGDNTRAGTAGHAHQKASPKRNPFRFFKHMASSAALASALALGSMAAPKQAAAQDASPYWYFSFGSGGQTSGPFSQIRNVPVAMRTVPVYPDDITAYNQDSSWSQPINPNIQPVSSSYIIPIRIARGVSFDDGRLLAELGIGGDIAIEYPTACSERNYLENYAPTAGDSTGFVRGYGTALTYYQVVLSQSVVPRVFAEIGIPHSRLAVGYEASMKWYQVVNGWDRWDTYTPYKSYSLTTLITGMPYLSVTVFGASPDNPSGLSLYGGVEFVTNNLPGAMARQAQTQFAFQPTFVLGFRWSGYSIRSD